MAKVDALAAQAAADGILYDAGFADGVLSAQSPGGGISAAQEALDIQAAVDAAVAPLNAQIAGLNLAKQEEDALLASVKTAAAALQALFPA